jgi:hypothetical protein
LGLYCCTTFKAEGESTSVYHSQFGLVPPAVNLLTTETILQPFSTTDKLCYADVEKTKTLWRLQSDQGKASQFTVSFRVILIRSSALESQVTGWFEPEMKAFRYVQ